MPEQNPAPAPRWLASAADTEAFIQQVRGDPLLAMDTEFIRTQTYFADLGLIQLGAGGVIGLADPLQPEVLEALRPLLAGPQIKLMHSASEDLEVLGRAFGSPPWPLYDTQIAALLCGYEQAPSYQKLVAQELGIALDKHATRTDWLQRPLDPEQLRYAAEDVEHLPALYRILSQRLEELGRSRWMEEECQRALNKAAQVSDPLPHLRVRSLERMQPQQQQRLWRLLCWRDREALARNRPRRWILDDAVAIRCALLDQIDPDRVSAAAASDDRPAPKLAAKLLELLQQPPSADELALNPYLPLSAEEKARAKEIKEQVTRVAGELGLNPEFLMNRRGIEHWARHGQFPDDLCGWRLQLLAT